MEPWEWTALWGQYGNRAGVPRILDVLEKAGVPATFFVPAVTALLHPDEQRRVVGEGHEVGLHGWIHEVNTKVPPDKERELTLRAADTLETVTGIRPVGMRTPSWDFSDATLSIERELGLDLRFLADGRRRSVRNRGSGRGDRDRRTAGRVDPRRFRSIST